MRDTRRVTGSKRHSTAAVMVAGWLAMLVALTGVLPAAASVAAPTAPGSLATPTAPATSGVLGTSGALGQRQFPEQSPPLEPTLIDVESLQANAVPGGTVELGFRVASDDPEATLTLEVHPRVLGRIRYQQSLAGENLGTALRSYADLSVATLPRDPEGVIRFAFEVFDSGADIPLTGLALPELGAYPLSLTIDDASGETIDQIVVHLIRLPVADDPDAPDTFALATVIPLTAPIALEPDGSVSVDPPVIDAFTAMVDVLERTPGTDATVLPTPETLTGLGRLDEAGGTELLDRLDVTLEGRQVMAGTYVPLALSSWTSAGRVEEIDRQLDAGQGALDRWLSGPTRRSTWLIDDTIDPTALAVLAQRGVAHVVVPESLLDPLNPSDFPVTLTQRFELRSGSVTMPAVQSDDELAELLSSAPQPAVAANRVLADLVVLARDNATIQRGAVLVLPDTGVATEALTTVLDGLDTVPPGAAPLLRSSSIDSLFDTISAANEPDSSDDVLARSWNWADPRPLGTFPGQLDAARRQVDTFATMVDPEVTSGPDEAAELLLTSPAATLTADERDAFVSGATQLVSAGTQVIEVPDQEAVTLTAREAVVPVALDNTAAYPVRVTLTLSSEKLEFPDGDRMDITLEPGSTRLEVLVRSRATGAFPVEFEVRSPDDALELGAARFTVRSTAFSGLGMALSIAAGLFLALWWIRNIRSTRRDRRLIASTHPVRSGKGPTGASDSNTGGDGETGDRPGEPLEAGGKDRGVRSPRSQRGGTP